MTPHTLARVGTRDMAGLKLEDIVDRPVLLGALRYRASHGDSTASRLLAQHDAAWLAAAASVATDDHTEARR